MSMNVNSNTRVCQRCGYDWEARKVQPRSCPSCHSYRWNADNVAGKAHTNIPLEPEKRLTEPPYALNMADFEEDEPESEAETWLFPKGVKPEYHDNGNVYRQQYLESNPKVKRTVQVDEDDLETIII